MKRRWTPTRENGACGLAHPKGSAAAAGCRRTQAYVSLSAHTGERSNNKGRRELGFEGRSCNGHSSKPLAPCKKLVLELATDTQVRVPPQTS